MNNPILTRETKLLLRNTPLLNRVFWAWCALAAVIFLLWPSEGIFSSEAQSSKMVFKTFAFGQLLLTLLIAPAITAPLITDEKEHGRFAMLFASLLKPFDVLFGKWFSSLMFQTLILLSSAPLLMLTIALGGISWQDILQVYLICFCAMLQFGSMGLYFSSTKSNTYDALLRSYAFMLIWVALTWLPSYLLGHYAFLVVPFTLLRSLSPFSAMLDVLDPDVLIYLGRLPKSWQWFEIWSPELLSYILASLFSTLAFYLLSLKRVFLLPLGKDIRSEVKEKDAKKKKFPYYILNPDKRRGPFGLGSLIFIKELRCKMFANIGQLIRGIYISFFVSLSIVILVTVNVHNLSFDAVRIVSVIFQCSVILLLTPVLTASSISEEYRSGTMEMLRMTPLSIWSFWKGKIYAGIFYMLILLLSSFPIYGLFVVLEIISQGNPLIVLEIVAIQSLLLVFCAVCGVWCSAITLNTQKAIGLTYAILFAFIIVPFAFPYFIKDTQLLEWLCPLSSFFVCIRQASLDSFKDLNILTQHFIIIPTTIAIMMGHSLIKTRQLMKQA